MVAQKNRIAPNSLAMRSISAEKKKTYIIQPQIRKSWDSMENANKKRSSDF